MKLQQLEYFRAAYRNENMSEAARELHISQPSISLAIQELEREFETALFLRTGKKLIPTPEGEHLYTLAGQLLEHTVNVKNNMKEFRSPKKTIRLGLTPMIDVVFFSKVIKEVSLTQPDIELIIEEQGSERLSELIRIDAIDCAVITHTETLSKDFYAIPLASLEVTYCVNRQNPLSDYSTVDMGRIARERLVLFKKGFLITSQIHTRMEEAGISSETLNVIYSDQLSTHKSFISENIASGFLYKSISESIPNTRQFSLSPPFFVKVSLVWKRGYENYPHMRRFIKILKAFISN